MTEQFITAHAAALISLVCAVLAGWGCAFAAFRADRGPAGRRRRLLWSTVGLIALVAFPLVGSAV